MATTHEELFHSEGLALYLGEKTSAVLMAMAAEQGLTPIEALKRCVGTYRRLRDERKQGCHILIKRQDGETVEILI